MMSSGRKPRLTYVVTHPVSADLLLRGQLAFMREHGFDVTIIAAPGQELERVCQREGVRGVAVPMARGNDVRRDPGSLARLTSELRKLRPDIVNASTPKAGLLGMMAARSVGVPVRIYLLRGLRLEGARGVMRRVLAVTERVASACAHLVACVSPSLLRASVEGGYISRRKALVIGHGSSNGVDLERFARTPELRAEGQRRLETLGVKANERIVGFVGRTVADKGIVELLEAFQRVRREIGSARLVLIGGDLAEEALDRSLIERIERARGVVAAGRSDDMAPWYAVMDVLAFPSHREGFPNVPLEAAAAGVPAVGVRSTGVVDAIVDGQTGTLVDKGDLSGLSAAIGRYLSDESLARAHGSAARARARDRFARPIVWNAWLDAYRQRLAARGLPLPRG